MDELREAMAKVDAATTAEDRQEALRLCLFIANSVKPGYFPDWDAFVREFAEKCRDDIALLRST